MFGTNKYFCIRTGPSFLHKQRALSTKVEAEAVQDDRSINRETEKATGKFL